MINFVFRYFSSKVFCRDLSFLQSIFVFLSVLLNRSPTIKLMFLISFLLSFFLFYILFICCWCTFKSSSLETWTLCDYMNCFCGMVDQRNALIPVSSLDHCQRFSPSQISDLPWADFEPARNLNSGFIEWMKLCSSDIHETTAP